MIRGDSSVPALITTVATVILVNAVAAWAIYAGMTMFAEDAQGKDRLARHDELTGLLNRRGLQQACELWSPPRWMPALALRPKRFRVWTMSSSYRCQLLSRTCW
ncbi:diguanylate cyclase/phosphodiesterase [Mycobacteroides abscessus subsp. abscessus]|nr:diguanylate cyclase/phosphodiesterase [Mycobacteroides abscessus subsp. abscessus]